MKKKPERLQIGPEHNIRIGPFRFVVQESHPDVEAGGKENDFLPLAAPGISKQALTDTFDPQSASSVVDHIDDAQPTENQMLSDLFAPQAQSRIAGSALASGNWLGFRSAGNSDFTARTIAFLGDVGIQLPIATLIAAVTFVIGLIASYLLAVPVENSEDFLPVIAQLSSPLVWLDTSQTVLTSDNQSAQAVWYLGISCGVCLSISWLSLVLVLPTIASGAPYWHRHYHLQICTKQGERPAVWQVCLRWALAILLAPISLASVLLRLPSIHDLVAGTRLRSD